MTVKPIRDPLFGERVIKVQPTIAPQVDASWRKRLNLFTGRALTDTALSAEQAERGGRLALRGQLVSPGTVAGLEASLEQRTESGRAKFFLQVTPGLGLCASGEDVEVPLGLQVDIETLPVYFDRDGLAPLVMRSRDALTAELSASPQADTSTPTAPPDPNSMAPQMIGGVTRALLNQLDMPVAPDDVLAPPQTYRLAPSLTALLAVAKLAAEALPLLFVVVLQPVQAEQVGNFNPADPCEQDPDNDPFDDLQIVDGCRLVLFHLPMAQVSRNQLAFALFEKERDRAPGQPAPWEQIGVPLGLLSIADATLATVQPPPMGAETFLDRAAVVRIGGKALTRSPLPGLRNPGNPMLWQARIDQFSAHLIQAVEEQSTTKMLPPLPESNLKPDLLPIVFFDLPPDIEFNIEISDPETGSVIPPDYREFSLFTTDTTVTTFAAENGNDQLQFRPLEHGNIGKFTLTAGQARLWIGHEDPMRTYRCTIWRTLNQMAPFRFLPPVGLLHRSAVGLLLTEKINGQVVRVIRNRFFPSSFAIDALPVPMDELDQLLDASAALDRFDATVPDFLRVLVPVPTELYEPGLLKVEPVDPEFAAAIDRFVKERGLWLLRRELLRSGLSAITKTITGQPLVFPSPDPSALEQPEEVAAALPAGEIIDQPFAIELFASVSDPKVRPYLFTCAAFSPDGSLVATGSADGFLRIWSTHSGRLRTTLGPHGNPVSWIAFSPIKVFTGGPAPHTGYLVLAALTNGAVSVWDPAGDRSKPLFSLDANATIIGAASFGVVGDAQGDLVRVIIKSTDQSIQIWEYDRATGLRRNLFNLGNATPVSVSMTGDGSRAVITLGGNEFAELWRFAEPPVPLLELDHVRVIFGRAASPPYDPAIVTLTGFSRTRIKLPSGANAWLVVTARTDGFIHIRDADSTDFIGALVRLSVGAPVLSFEFSPDGKYLATLDTQNEVKIWDWQAPLMPRVNPNVNPTVLVTTVSLGALPNPFAAFFRPLAFSPDSQRLIVTDGPRAQIIDVRSGTRLATLEHKESLTAVEFSPDGYFALTAAIDGVVKLWAIKNELSEFWTFLRDDTTLNTEDLDQINTIGVQGVVDQLNAVIQEANQQIDLGFLRVQTDIYRIRQLMLNNSAATRLATAPSLAEIAQGESAVAVRADVQNLLERLKDKPQVVG